MHLSEYTSLPQNHFLHKTSTKEHVGFLANDNRWSASYKADAPLTRARSEVQIEYGSGSSLLFLLFSGIEGAAFPVFTVILGYLLNTLDDSSDDVESMSLKALGFFILLALVTAVLHFFCTKIASQLAAQCDVKFRGAAFRSLLAQDTAYIERALFGGSSELITQLARDSELVSYTITISRALLMGSWMCFLSSLLIAFIAQWLLTLFFCITFPLLLFVYYLHWRCSKSYYPRMHDEEANDVGSMILLSHQVINASNLEEAQASHFKRLLAKGYSSNLRQASLSFCSQSFSFFIYATIVYGCGMYIGSVLVARGDTGLGYLLTAFLAFTCASAAALIAWRTYVTITASDAAAGRLYDIIDRQSQLRPPDLEMTQKVSLQGHIEFNRVSFVHPNSPGLNLFDFSLTVKPNETCVLIGDVFSGNQTIMLLLERFYESRTGSICIDNIPIHNIDITSLRNQIGLLVESPILFGTTISNTISYCQDTASSAQIEKAALMAHAHSWISELPLGYESLLEETLLSIGQKQQLCLARELLKQPAILILHHCTSHLDADSTRELQSAIADIIVSKYYTVLIIASSLSGLPKVDRIVEFSNGQYIVE